MFLDKLEGKEREVFLDLAVQTAKANGMVEGKEKELIKHFCREMAISEYTIYDTKTIEEAAAFFKNAKKWKKKIIISELIGIGVADGKFNKEERKFIDELADEMEIKKECVDSLEEVVKDYYKAAKKIREEIFE